MRGEEEEKPDMLEWKYGACFPRPPPAAARVGERAKQSSRWAPGGQRVCSGSG